MGLKYVCIDFETEAIQRRPQYPPRPVGVAILEPGRKPRYLAWGHPTENNATRAQAQRELRDVWRSGRPILFHNAKFDLEVAEKHLGLKVPPWHLIHDTMFLLFLTDPHAPNLQLKPSAARLLGMEPNERDEMNEWLVNAGVIKKVNQKDAGAFICKAPGNLVGKYAVGDVVRTAKLFDLLMPKLDDGMKQAYDRERRLLPILLRNEQEGIRVDEKRLARDEKAYSTAMATADAWLALRLGVPDLQVDANEKLADALESAGVVPRFNVTATGKRSVSKDNLTRDLFTDPQVFTVLGYRNRLSTCLGTFVRPWLEMARANNGYIYTSWNQVRQHSDQRNGGTRTGRMSCSPNFQNIPKTWGDKGDDYEHPATMGVPPLPLMRRYLLPDVGGLFGHRDYNQQELRILAHFEDDKLLHAYLDNPRLDVHDFVGAAITEITGHAYERRAVKVLNFGMVYGMGVGRLAEAIQVDVEQARRLRNAQRAALPGLGALEKAIRTRANALEPIRTWGGRLYLPEPPKEINGRVQTFEYKLLNYLIQGSAADCTKEAVIRYDEARKDGRFLVTVHDEINISAPKGAEKEELVRLRGAMESVEFSIPMLSDAKVGKSWGELKSLKEAR